MTKSSRKLVYDILYDIAGSLALATGIYCFAEKVNIAPGGASGIAIMIKYLTGLPVGLVILVINIPLVLIAFKFLGKRFTLRTLRTLLISTVILDVVVTPFFPQYSGDRMLGSIFGGVCMGSGLGIIFLRGSSTAGTDIVSYLVEQKYPHIQIGKAMMFVDGVIIALSAVVFSDVEAALFGVVSLFCQTRIVNQIVYGSEKGRNILVISEKTEEIAQRILLEKNRGATFLNAQGAYSKKPSKVLMCVVRVWEYHEIKEIIYEEDPKAFVIASEAEHIMGEGFSDMKGKS
ncbi:MAG: YitT family protein [Clostridia bacterium]|nr:YitT family protein [Clostridia bacterium]